MVDLQVQSTHQMAELRINECVITKPQESEAVQIENQGDADHFLKYS